MGIRFTCPQGHQLNVKSELAGKRGVCPQCGAKVQIPSDSLPPRGRVGVGAEPEIPTPAVVESLPVSTAVAEPVVVSPVPEPAPVVADAPFVAKPQVADVAVEEAWYVRPPGGGQFGPAPRNDFAQWIRDGRVVPEAFVWRVGWADWRHAREVAGELPAPLPVVATAAVPTAAPVSAPSPALIVVPERLPMTARPVARRKRSAKRQISLAILLLVITAILGGVLYWVLTRNPPETEQVATCSMAYDVLG